MTSTTPHSHRVSQTHSNPTRLLSASALDLALDIDLVGLSYAQAEGADRAESATAERLVGEVRTDLSSNATLLAQLDLEPAAVSATMASKSLVVETRDSTGDIFVVQTASPTNSPKQALKKSSGDAVDGAGTSGVLVYALSAVGGVIFLLFSKKLMCDSGSAGKPKKRSRRDLPQPLRRCLVHWLAPYCLAYFTVGKTIS
jgi:hypothetical protein